ncbi:hypothetical protein OKW41_006002 [Paraburkholderia sp. UCT70]|uniref:hypothetical protein n=1 Tax=Paraburkholderia sp. UCT70 TaxID=2991068 RepID=UPI003D1EEC9E
MATKPPVVQDGDYHRPLAAGDVLAGGAVQLSAESSNSLRLGADGGLFVPAVKSDSYAMAINNNDLSQAEWVSAGSPLAWNIAATQLLIPDALLNKVCLCFLNVSVSPVIASALGHYEATLSGSVLSLFNLIGGSTGRLAVKPDSDVPVPSWGIYLVNSARAQLPPGSSLTLNPMLVNVNFTANNGVIRVYQRLTLVPFP